MERKPRIAIVITAFHPHVGGAETQTLAQGQRLIQAGYRTRVFTFSHHYTWAPYEIIQGVPTKRVARVLLGRRKHLPRLIQKLLYFLALFVMTWTIWRERKNFDVLQLVQCNTLALPLAFVCWLAHKPMTVVVISAGSGKPIKTNEPARLLAGTLNPDIPWLAVNNTFWIDADLHGLQALGPLFVRLTRSLLTRIGAVMIVLSTRMAAYMKLNDFDIPGTRLIPNGVDTERFHQAALVPGETIHAKTVVCVSKARYEKGIDVLLHAWHIVQQSQPEAHLIIVGNGPVLEQLQKIAAALNITQSVEFAGLQSDVPAQLHRGEIGVLPSRWEGMPNALLEAMSSGLACVATRVSGSEDLIQSGVNGLLVDTDDYQGMAEALLTLLGDTELIRRYGAAARASIEEGYTLNHILDMYIAVYQELFTKNQLATAKKLASSGEYSVTP